VYIPKWVPISNAISHVCVVQGLWRPVAEDLLVLALRDGDVKARYLATGEPVPQERWRAVAVHPINMPSLHPVEICVDDLIRHWPEQADTPGYARRGTMDRNIVPAFVLANTALSETIEFLRKADSLHRSDVDRSLREELDYADTLKLTERASDCLRTACSARDLTMVVIDPRTQHRHEVPAEYFDQRAIVDLEFSSAFFRACERSELVVADPLFQMVAPFRGWVHGFLEDDFRGWLKNPDLGPLAGPRMRRVFHMAPHERAIVADTATPPAPGRRGRKPGSGSIDDTEQILAMLHLLAAGKTRSVHDAAGKAAEMKVGSHQSRGAVIGRLRRKFTKEYGTEPPSGQKWRDVVHQLHIK
jgi:hypothetical protein